MTDDVLTPEERDLLAAEHALGLLQGSDHAMATRLYLRDQAFAELVEQWQARLAPLFDHTPDAAPDDQVWRKLIDAISSDHRSILRKSVQFWRVATVAVTAVAASLLFVVVTRVPPPPPAIPAPASPAKASPVVIAQLRSPEGEQFLVARYENNVGRLRIRAEGLSQAGGVPELWVIPVGGAPKSLGLVPRQGMTEVVLSDEARALIADGATLAISIENAEGAPHAAPAGPIVATGAISKI